MTRFRYLAADTDGHTRKGFIEAPDPEAARKTLRHRELLPMSLSADRGDILHNATAWIGRRAGQVSGAEVAVFTRQMATMTTSGVQIEVSLAAIADQSAPRLATLCKNIRQKILDGGSLSTAMRNTTDRFDRFFLTSIQAGEKAGRLGVVLSHLADHAESKLRNRQTVTLALIYPAILIVVSVAVVVALLVFVLPDIVRVFTSRGADLPTLTKMMIGLSDFLSAYAMALLLVVLAMGAGLVFLLRQGRVRKHLDRILWRSGIARQVTIVQFSGTLATLTQSGVALSDALSAAKATVGNTEARAILDEVTSDVFEGASLSRALSQHSGFPPMMITMIASGEASGTLPAMLARFSQDQSQVLQARVKTLVGLVEPLVLLLMGGVVMLLVLAILLPIVNLNSLVG